MLGKMLPLPECRSVLLLGVLILEISPTFISAVFFTSAVVVKRRFAAGVTWIQEVVEFSTK